MNKVKKILLLLLNCSSLVLAENAISIIDVCNKDLTFRRSLTEKSNCNSVYKTGYDVLTGKTSRISKNYANTQDRSNVMTFLLHQAAHDFCTNKRFQGLASDPLHANPLYTNHFASLYLMEVVARVLASSENNYLLDQQKFFQERGDMIRRILNRCGAHKDILNMSLNYLGNINTLNTIFGTSLMQSYRNISIGYKDCPHEWLAQAVQSIDDFKLTPINALNDQNFIVKNDQGVEIADVYLANRGVKIYEYPYRYNDYWIKQKELMQQKKFVQPLSDPYSAKPTDTYNYFMNDKDLGSRINETELNYATTWLLNKARSYTFYSNGYSDSGKKEEILGNISNVRAAFQSRKKIHEGLTLNLNNLSISLDPSETQSLDNGYDSLMYIEANDIAGALTMAFHDYKLRPKIPGYTWRSLTINYATLNTIGGNKFDAFKKLFWKVLDKSFVVDPAQLIVDVYKLLNSGFVNEDRLRKFLESSFSSAGICYNARLNTLSRHYTPLKDEYDRSGVYEKKIKLKETKYYEKFTEYVQGHLCELAFKNIPDLMLKNERSTLIVQWLLENLTLEGSLSLLQECFFETMESPRIVDSLIDAVCNQMYELQPHEIAKLKDIYKDFEPQ